MLTLGHTPSRVIINGVDMTNQIHNQPRGGQGGTYSRVIVNGVDVTDQYNQGNFSGDPDNYTITQTTHLPGGGMSVSTTTRSNSRGGNSVFNM